MWSGDSEDCQTHTCPLPSPTSPAEEQEVTCQDQLVTILEPSLGPVHTRLKGMPYFFRMMGEMSVILCLKKASQPCELPGKKPGVEESSVRMGISVGTGVVGLILGSGH